MKQALNKLLSNKYLEPIIFLLVMSLLYEFVIKSGLASSDTFINTITSIFVLFLMVFSYYYIAGFKIFKDEEEEHHIEPGETEFDYIPHDEIKKKKVGKKKAQHIIHPKVKKK